MKHKTTSLAALAALALSSSAQAATITWGGANTITGDAGSGIAVKNYQPNWNVTQSTTTGTADISSTGTSVFAMNFTGADSWINRVTFFESTPQQTLFLSGDDGGAFTQNGVTLTLGAGWSGNTRIDGNSPQGNSYGAVVGYTWDTLSYMRWINGTSGTMTFSGLTVGQEYAIQYWVQDSRTGVGDINSRNLTLDTQTVLDYNNGSGVGQWAIGTFTADNESQTINIAANSSVQVNMLQLRAIPEPGSALLGGLGLLALLRRRR